MNTNKNGFTNDQQLAFDALTSGKNVFLSGNAGTGKTYVLNAFIDWCISNKKSFICCAPTGVAAQNLRFGTTIHRAFKINPTSYEMPANATKEVNVADVIIVDEISMVSCMLFDQMAAELKVKNEQTRHHQLVVVGDFFQLPPVIPDKKGKKGEPSQLDCLKQYYPNIAQSRGYAFTSNSWSEFRFNCFNLSEIIRQNEPEFIKNLNFARLGDIECISFFNSKIVKDASKIGKKVIKIAGTNKTVEKINHEQLQKLKGKAKIFKAKIDDPEHQLRSSDKPVEDQIELKKNARVMIVTNAETISDYQNGSLGTIQGFDTDNGFPIVKWDTGKIATISPNCFEVKVPFVEYVEKDGVKVPVIKVKTIASFEQIPLKLAYAITMHKVQGKTFDEIDIADPHCWDPGQLYVALSRVKSIKGLYLEREIHESDLITAPAVLEYYQNFNNKLIDNGMSWVNIKCPEHLIPSVQEYIQTLISAETEE